MLIPGTSPGDVSQQTEHWQWQGVLVMTSSLYPVLVLQLPSALQRAGSPLQSWQTHLFSPCRQPWWCVTAGRTLAGAISGGGFIAVGLVTGLGLDISCPSGKCGLDSLDLGEPQSWRQGLLQVGLLHPLMFLSLTAESPDRNMTGTLLLLPLPPRQYETFYKELSARILT